MDRHGEYGRAILTTVFQERMRDVIYCHNTKYLSCSCYPVHTYNQLCWILNMFFFSCCCVDLLFVFFVQNKEECFSKIRKRVALEDNHRLNSFTIGTIQTVIALYNGWYWKTRMSNDLMLQQASKAFDKLGHRSAICVEIGYVRACPSLF